jgi:predicted metal-dependent hydrolase
MDTLPIRISKRAKRMSLIVHPGGRWEVVVPHQRIPSKRSILIFVADHRDWIERHTTRAAKITRPRPITHEGMDRSQVEQNTLKVIEEVIILLRRHQPFTVHHVRLGNWKTQWGSCSSSNTLGFHYKLSLLPRHLSEYVIAHELCHTIHFNHSKDFWNLVETLCTGSKDRKKQLSQFVL